MYEYGKLYVASKKVMVYWLGVDSSGENRFASTSGVLYLEPEDIELYCSMQEYIDMGCEKP